MPEPLLTVDDLAAVLRTTPAAIRQGRRRGSSLPRGFKIGRRILFRPEDVEAWIESQAERAEIPLVSGTSDVIPPERIPT